MANRPAFWRRTRSESKFGFDKIFRPYSPSKPGAPTTKLTTTLVSEHFWPSTIDKESNKAACILRSFCKDGIYQDQMRENGSHEVQRQQLLRTIPEEVISNAKGLAIFTVMRAGLWKEGAGGSGVIVARTEDGSWSPPAGIEIQTAELGFLVGQDILDCVLVLNTSQAVEAFYMSRCIVGGDIYAVPGPLGVGWFFQKDSNAKQAPIFSYLRSRGYYAPFQMDHSIVSERSDENREFYGTEKASARAILSGQLEVVPASILGFIECLKVAEGNTDHVSEKLLPAGPPPSDFEVVEEGHSFGIPDRDDPDPFGVLALEKQGLLIREAGTQMSPASETFDFNPSVSSPIYDKYNRRSVDMSPQSGRSSWRKSVLDSHSVRSGMSDHDSIPPGSPTPSQSSRHIHFEECESPATYQSSDRVNGDHQINGRSDSSHRDSLNTRSARSSLRHGIIYEDMKEADDEGEPHVEPPRDHIVVEEMIQQLKRNGPTDEHLLESSPLGERNNEIPAEKPVDVGAEVPQEPQLAAPFSSGGVVDAQKNVNATTHELTDADDVLDEDTYDDDLDELSDSDMSDSGAEIHEAVVQNGEPAKPAVVFRAASQTAISKPRIVNVTKPPPPALPTRNPGRLRVPVQEDSEEDHFEDAEITPTMADIQAPFPKNTNEIQDRTPPPSPPPQNMPGWFEPEPIKPLATRWDEINEPVSPVDPAYDVPQLPGGLPASQPNGISDDHDDGRPDARAVATLANIRKNLGGSPSPEHSPERLH